MTAALTAASGELRPDLNFQSEKEREGRGKRERRDRAHQGRPPYPPARHRRRGGGCDSAGGSELDSDSVATGKKKTIFVENPLATFLKFATRSSSNLSDLKQASGHFHKFQEISHKVELTFRTSTKFGEVK